MTRGRRHGFRVTCLGVCLDVVCDSAATAEELERWVLPWLPRAALDGAAPDHVAEVRRVDAGALEVLIDGASVGAVPDALTAVAPVQRALDEAVVRRQSAFALVHAGAVVHCGRAILLPAPSGSGKSRLVAELVRRGAPYLSDEFALVDAAGLVHPYPRPLLLREPSGLVLPALAADLGGAAAAGPVPIGLVLGLRYRGGAALRVEATSQADGMLLLLRNTPQVLADQPWILEPLERAAAAAACYAGERGDAPDAAPAVLALAESAARRGADAPRDRRPASAARPAG